MPTALVTDTSDISEDWELIEPGHRAASMIVQMRRSLWVYPWFRFSRAEGCSDTAELFFMEDRITIDGNRLDVLIRAVAEHRVLRLIQPTKNEAKFNVRGIGAIPQTGRPTITEIRIDGENKDDAEFQDEDDLSEDEDFDGNEIQ